MEAYDLKDSGVDWINKLPKKWKLRKLQYIVEVKDGTHDTPSYEQSHVNSYPFVTSKDINDNKINFNSTKFINKTFFESFSKRSNVCKGDIIMPMIGTLGNAAIVDTNKKFAIKNVALFKTSESKKVIMKYLFYFIESKVNQDQFYLLSKGGVQSFLSLTTLRNLQLITPTLNEQKAIADYLDKTCQNIDKTLILKQQQLDKLEAYRKSVIHEAVTKGLDKTVPMKDSGVEWLGEIPIHWSISQLKYVIEFHDNRRIPLSSEERGVMLQKIYDYYGASGVIDKVDNYIFDEPMILLGEDGANLITRSKPLAFIARGQYWVNNHAHILKPKQGNIEYWTYILENMEYSLFVTGAAQPKLSSMNLGKINLVYVKGIDEQNAITQFLNCSCKRINDTKKTITNQIKTLTQYRQSLIHECVTGKKRIYQG